MFRVGARDILERPVKTQKTLNPRLKGILSLLKSISSGAKMFFQAPLGSASLPLVELFKFSRSEEKIDEMRGTFFPKKEKFEFYHEEKVMKEFQHYCDLVASETFDRSTVDIFQFKIMVRHYLQTKQGQRLPETVKESIKNQLSSHVNKNGSAPNHLFIKYIMTTIQTAQSNLFPKQKEILEELDNYCALKFDSLKSNAADVKVFKVFINKYLFHTEQGLSLPEQVRHAITRQLDGYSASSSQRANNLFMESVIKNIQAHRIARNLSEGSNSTSSEKEEDEIQKLERKMRAERN